MIESGPWRRRVDELVLGAGAWLGLDAELRLLPRLCQCTRGFVDVGAHRGRWTRVALRHAARVTAVEPDASYAPRLQRLSPRVDVVVAALGDRCGRATFHVPEIDGRPLATRGSLVAGADPGLPTRVCEVEVRRLDDLGLQAIAAIKIDVEGHELAVLQGGDALLERERPALVIEIEERHRTGAVAEATTWLAARGYDGFFLDGGELCSIGRFVAAVHQDPRAAKPPGRSRARFVGPYVNNFVFVHRADARVRRTLGLVSAA